MSESNLTEKISDNMISVIKKTNFFENIKNIEFYINSFFMVGSVIGISGLIIHYFNYTEIKKNRDELIFLRDEIISFNKSIITINKLCLENLQNCEKKILNSLEDQLFTLNEIKNLPLLTIGRIDKLSINTSFSSILDSPQQKIESIHSEFWGTTEL